MFVNGKILKEGYTTGSCAAAAAKAAILDFNGHKADFVDIDTSLGTLNIPIEKIVRYGDYSICSVIKNAGDDPDATDGLEICAKVTLNDTGTIIVDGGEGVGTVTRRGLKVEVGKKAINPGPMKMIKEEAAKVLKDGQGVDIVISIPKGEEVASKTFNLHIGIVGGISVLGTTGVVKPMSEDAYKESLAIDIDMLKEEGMEDCTFVFGESGKALAIKLGINEKRCIMTSNFLGYMLDYANYKKIKSILLVGQLGKMCKVAAGIFNTHSRVADGRMETLTALTALCGGDIDTLNSIYNCLTTEEAIEIINDKGLQRVYDLIVERIMYRVKRYVKNEIHIEIILYSDGNEFLGKSEGAEELRRINE
ncbi:cobalt-precorrin-5B (C(1))-methyltransferase CbiD [Clostridium cadaveris]|uniref:cobalt-precorrin-5B (C(1))-methyltransferase CbiD n=1 Tax=Clostridium cadaveris TaxID=1529 RepID=UPI001E5D1AE6|nr:cobalt-precorrin-5B (C(1))-methyltransferase CbiD [Clostridium cadaveris]UFH65135.1 cobalt-precorrin-5B (C(1))-methyltransferase CbiD [Clostridium cadaveris]